MTTLAKEVIATLEEITAADQKHIATVPAKLLNAAGLAKRNGDREYGKVKTHAAKAVDNGFKSAWYTDSKEGSPMRLHILTNVARGRLTEREFEGWANEKAKGKRSKKAESFQKLNKDVLNAVNYFIARCTEVEAEKLQGKRAGTAGTGKPTGPKPKRTPFELDVERLEKTAKYIQELETPSTGEAEYLKAIQQVIQLAKKLGK